MARRWRGNYSLGALEYFDRFEEISTVGVSHLRFSALRSAFKAVHVVRKQKSTYSSGVEAVLKGELPFEKARQMDARARECTWPSFVPAWDGVRARAWGLRQECGGRDALRADAGRWGAVGRGEARRGASFVFSRGCLTRWRRCLGTVGIRDMCVPTHAALVVRTRGGHLVMFGKRGVTERKKRKGKDRTYPVRGAYIGRHKARNPWEYRACASLRSCAARVMGWLATLLYLFFFPPPSVYRIPWPGAFGDFLTTWLLRESGWNAGWSALVFYPP